MAIVVGSVAVDVVPSVKEFTRKARAQLIPEADKLGQDIGKHIGDNIRRRLEEELKRLPNVNINADTGKFDTKIREVKDKLDEVGKRHATATVDADVKDAGLTAFTTRIDALDKRKVHVPVEPVVHKEELDGLKVTLDKLATGKIRPEVKPDIHKEGLDELRVTLGKTDAEKIRPEVKPKVESEAVRALRATLSELTSKVYNVPVDVKDTKAVAKIARLKARLAKLGHDLERPEIGLEGALRVEAEMAAINHELTEFGRKRETAHVNVSGVSQSEGGMRRLIDTILAIAPAAIPVAGVLTGIAGGLVGFASAATAGLGAIGLVVKGQMSVLQEDLFKIKLDNQKIAAAQALVDSAKGPKERTAALKKLSQAQKILNADTKSFAPGERTLLGLVGQLTVKWKQFIFSVVPAEVAPFKAFLRFLTPLFKLLTPLIEASFKAIARLLNGAAKALGSPLWKRFFAFLTAQAGPAITALGKIIGNLITGFIGLLIALSPLTKLVERGLVSITQKFADWGKNANASSFKDFISFIKGVGPDVGRFLAAVGKAIVAIIQAAAPVGVFELKILTGVLTNLANFATKHKTIAEVAIAVFTLSRAVKALKLAAAGGGLLKVLTAIGAVRTGGLAGLFKLLVGNKITGAVAAGRLAAAGGGAAGAEALGGSAVGAVGLAGLGLSVATVGIIAAIALPFVIQAIKPGFWDKRKGPPLPFAEPPGGGKPFSGGFAKDGQELIDSATRAAIKQININTGKTADNTAPGKPKGPKPPPPAGGGQGTVSYGLGKLPSTGTVYPNAAGFTGPPVIPNVKVGVNSTAATLAIFKVERALLHLPKNKNITVNSPGAKDTQQAIDNVYLSQKHLPGTRVIKVSAPGGNLSALTLVNVSRAVRGLKPIAKVNVSAPGAVGAKQSITNLLHASGLLPKGKSIKTDTPGSRAAILSFINLDRQAHGLPPLKRIPTSAPGADHATQLIIRLAQRAGLLPKGKQIKTDTPGAQTAIDNINTLLRRAHLLPKGKSIPTSVPGATKSILTYIQLYEKAHHLPISKSIPTNAPGGDHTIQQMIDLAGKVGLVPKSHDTKTSASGAAKTNLAIQTLIDTLGRLADKNYEFHVQGSGSWSASGLPPLTGDGGIGHGPGGAPGHARGGPIHGAGGPRQDNIPIWASAGEYMQPADTVSHYGTEAMDAIRRKRALIVPGFAGGGPIKGNLIGHVDGVTGIPGILRGAKEVIPRGIGQMAATFKKAVAKFLESFMGTPGGGVGQWIGVVRQALALLHQPLGLAGLFLKVIQGESGGNPRAINLTDSNARAGHPSVGLAQVIRGTFDAFAGPFRNVGPFLAGVSINPLANVFAGLNYGIQTYGSVASIPGIASLLHGGGYRPYAKGGPASAGVPILVGEAGPEIFTPQVAGTVIPNGGGTVGTLPDTATIVHVYLGNREITDIVRTETERASVGQARSLGAGRRRLR